MQSLRCYFYVLVFCVLAGCLLAAPASADNSIVSSLTGTFYMSAGFNGEFNPGGMILYGGTPDGAWGIWAGAWATLTWTNDYFCYYYIPDGECGFSISTSTFHGDIVTGNSYLEALQIDSSNLDITMGPSTSGWVDGYIKTSCGPIPSIPACTVAESPEFFNYTFRGVWSNGWWSEGSVVIAGNLEWGGGSGPLDITTHTPEPGTFALLATGFVPVIGGLRGKLHR